MPMIRETILTTVGADGCLHITPIGVILLHDRAAGSTYVNEERVERAELLDGDEIRLGDVRFTYIEG